MHNLCNLTKSLLFTTPSCPLAQKLRAIRQLLYTVTIFSPCPLLLDRQAADKKTLLNSEKGQRGCRGADQVCAVQSFIENDLPLRTYSFLSAKTLTFRKQWEKQQKILQNTCSCYCFFLLLKQILSQSSFCSLRVESALWQIASNMIEIVMHNCLHWNS